DLAVTGVGRVARRVSDRGRIDAGELPELALGAPETAESEDRLLQPVGERRLQPGAVDEVRLGHRHLLLPPRQRVVFGWHARLGEHPFLPSPLGYAYRGFASRGLAGSDESNREPRTANRGTLILRHHEDQDRDDYEQDQSRDLPRALRVIPGHSARISVN